MLKVKNDLAEMFSNLVDTDSIVLICGTDYAAGDLLRALTLAGIEIYGFAELKSQPEISEYHSLPVVSAHRLKNISSNITLIYPLTYGDEATCAQVISNNLVNNEAMQITAYVFDSDAVKGWGWLDYAEKLPQIYNDIFPDCSDCTPKYLKGLTTVIPAYLVNNNYHYNDYKSKHINVKDGMRVTVPPSSEAKNSIHLMGQSFIFGFGVEDKDTISSRLQTQINQSKNEQIYGYACFNHGVIGEELNHMVEKICSLSLRHGDIVIATNSIFAVPPDNSYLNNTLEENNLLYLHYLQIAQRYCKEHGAQLLVVKIPSVNDVQNPSEWEKKNIKLNFQRNNEAKKIAVNIDANAAHFSLDWKSMAILCSISGIPFFNLSEAVERPHNFGELFLDWFHLGPAGATRIAQALFNVCFLNKTTADTSAHIKKLAAQIDKSYLNQLDPKLKQYIEALKEASHGNPSNAGIIIINGNPFTLGHRYLIEMALRVVPYLYILVLEEDKSAFSFAERIDLIRKGTADLENVTVLPSGQFVISSVTFPEYFHKDAKQNSVVDASTDIALFGKHIAPALRATKRFVGDEPYCNITNQYNQQMKQELPQYGMEFIVLQRLTVGETAISASLVRKLLAENDLEKLQSYLPKTTLDYVLASPKWNSNL